MRGMNCRTIEKVVLKSATKETAASFERVENARQENVAQYCRVECGKYSYGKPKRTIATTYFMHINITNRKRTGRPILKRTVQTGITTNTRLMQCQFQQQSQKSLDNERKKHQSKRRCKVPEGSTLFSDTTNFLVTQCRIGGRKRTCKKQLDLSSRFVTTPASYRRTDICIGDSIMR